MDRKYNRSKGKIGVAKIMSIKGTKRKGHGGVKRRCISGKKYILLDDENNLLSWLISPSFNFAALSAARAGYRHIRLIEPGTSTVHIYSGERRPSRSHSRRWLVNVVKIGIEKLPKKLSLPGDPSIPPIFPWDR